jgi:tetratricopeptide (TPR) repeat protein
MGLFDLSKSNYRSHDRISTAVPDEIKRSIIEALAETKGENYSVAVTIYKKIIPDYPNIEFIRNNAGCCLAGLEKFDEAETEFIEAIRLTKVNRDNGASVPRSYPKEPARNLIKLYKTVLSKKKCGSSTPRPPENQISIQARLLQSFQRNVRSLRRKGFIVALKRIPSILNTGLHPVIRWHEKVFALRAEEFDRKNNIDTAGIVYQTDLRMNNKNQLHAVYYQGSDSLLFNNALSSLKINFSDYTFIDFGSGKGKALFLAASYPFKKIIGIEFSDVLSAVAQENIRRFKRDNIESLCMDAVAYKIPEESIVCYFYDPFDEYIMTKIIDNLRKTYHSCKKKILIVYYIARFSNLFDAEPWLERENHIGPVMMWSSKCTSPAV